MPHLALAEKHCSWCSQAARAATLLQEIHAQYPETVYAVDVEVGGWSPSLTPVDHGSLISMSIAFGSIGISKPAAAQGKALWPEYVYWVDLVGGKLCWSMSGTIELVL